jgi:hypothetical protein
VVFTLPAQIGAIAYQNKARVYGLLFKAAAETLTTIAAESRQPRYRHHVAWHRDRASPRREPANNPHRRAR